MRAGVCIKYGWDVFHGCQLIVKKYRLVNIVEISHLKELESKIDDMDSTTIEMKDGYITLLLPRVDQNKSMSSAIKSIDQIGNMIQYYGVKEATSLVELALWKATISQVDEKVYPINRDACRVEVPGPAKDLILKYAYTIPRNTTTCYPIRIKSSRGVSPSIMYIEPTDTIAKVKKQIRDDKDIPVDQQQLFFRGELLNDDLTLADCNIQMGSIVLLFVGEE